MKTVYRCQSRGCDYTSDKPQHFLLTIGNICVASGGGLIGNNLSENWIKVPFDKITLWEELKNIASLLTLNYTLWKGKVKEIYWFNDKRYIANQDVKIVKADLLCQQCFYNATIGLVAKTEQLDNVVMTKLFEEKQFIVKGETNEQGN